jgi:hypothetical protein
VTDLINRQAWEEVEIVEEEAAQEVREIIEQYLL